ncbi:uncharacterized protein ACIBXB_016656 isoform 1-T1 [Morphnus guianensis]
MLLMVLTRFLGGYDSCKQYQQCLGKKTDKFKRKVINQREFQAATECRFGVEITDEEFELLLDRIPLDEDGNVRYPQFMARFDSCLCLPASGSFGAEFSCPHVCTQGCRI